MNSENLNEMTPENAVTVEEDLETQVETQEEEVDTATLAAELETERQKVFHKLEKKINSSLRKEDKKNGVPVSSGIMFRSNPRSVLARSGVSVRTGEEGLTISDMENTHFLNAGPLSVAYLNAQLRTAFQKVGAQGLCNDDFDVAENDIMNFVPNLTYEGFKPRNDQDVLNIALEKRVGKVEPKLWTGYCEVELKEIVDDEGLLTLKEEHLPEVYYISARLQGFAKYVQEICSKEFVNAHLKKREDHTFIILTNWADADHLPPLPSMCKRNMEIELANKARDEPEEEQEEKEQVTLPTIIARDERSHLLQQGLSNKEANAAIAANLAEIVKRTPQDDNEAVYENFAQIASTQNLESMLKFIRQPSVASAFRKGLPSIGKNAKKWTSIFSTVARTYAGDTVITNTVDEMYGKVFEAACESDKAVKDNQTSITNEQKFVFFKALPMTWDINRGKVFWKAQ